MKLWPTESQTVSFSEPPLTFKTMEDSLQISYLYNLYNLSSLLCSKKSHLNIYNTLQIRISVREVANIHGYLSKPEDLSLKPEPTVEEEK